MPEKRDLMLFVDDIIEAINKIEKYTKDIDHKTFINNEMIADAVIRNFEIIGEASNNKPKEIQEKYKYVEWKEIIGFKEHFNSWLFWHRYRNSLGHH